VPDHVVPADLDRIEAEHLGDFVDGALDRDIGRRLAEAAHRLLRGLVGDHRHGAVLHAFDFVGPTMAPIGLPSWNGERPA